MTDRLLTWAEDQFWQQKQVNSQGTTQAKVLRQIEKTAGLKLGRSPPQLPSCVWHIWDWFMALLPSYQGADPSPARWRQDIQAFFGFDPKPWEIRLLISLFARWKNSQS